MDDLARAFAGWTDPDLQLLAEGGLTVTKLATLAGCREKGLESILVAARRRKETFSQDVAGLKELVGQCDKRSANVHQADAGRGSQDLLEAHLEHQREKRRKVLEGLGRRARQAGGHGQDLQVADTLGEEVAFSWR